MYRSVFKRHAASIACLLVLVAFAQASAEERVNTTTPPTATKTTAVKLLESTNSIGMKFRLIPAGTFTMGERDERRKVTVTQCFKIGVHEVTQAQYEQVMGVNPSFFKGIVKFNDSTLGPMTGRIVYISEDGTMRVSHKHGRSSVKRGSHVSSAENPVEEVNWSDAVAFCAKLSALPAEKAAGNVYRLPTAAEWEYAARAGTATQYTWGDDGSKIGDYAWYSSNASRTTHPVGGKQPNAWGLYDMTGNVMEWCHDSPGYGGEVLRVLRGGNWSHDADKIIGSAKWIWGSRAAYGGDGTGFRVALSPSGK